MSSISYLNKIILFFIVISIIYCSTPTTIKSFKQLGQYHCQTFPIQILYRLSSGTLAQKYGSKYQQIDCYIRQFVNQDGQNIQNQDGQEEDQQQQNNNQQQLSQQKQSYKYPQNDPILIQYSLGLSKCLPSSLSPMPATYQIYRFYRYLLQHDYLYQWMRAKIRSGLGYQAQRPNAWMDGQINSQRLRLDKLFSNQFYDYVDKLMFKDFLTPLLMFYKKNVVVAVEADVTENKQAILMQYIQSRNIHQQVFKPIIFIDSKSNKNIFTFTLPGIPLFLGGSTTEISWAFTGILIDRSNIEQIQTVGNKFYHDGLQQWIKLNNVSISIPVKDSQSYTCTYMHSAYGTLYQKHNRSGKVSEYIARWHEDEKKVRNLFTEMYNLIVNNGNMSRDIDFPFNSLVIANKTGVFNYLCPPFHPSYFIYPDLASQPDPIANRWIKQPKKHIFTFANTHLSSINPQNYLKKQILNTFEQQIIIQLRRLISKQKLTKQSLWQLILNIQTDPLLKKRKQHLIYIYRKSKFVFFPQQQQRKQCDQLISIIQKWDNSLNSQQNSIVFILWDFYFRHYTMNHVSSSEYGSYIVKHKALTDNYWTGQPDLWKKTVSYGQCDSNQWYDQKWDKKLNNTGLNCTCFYNVNRAINMTREILKNITGNIKQKYLLEDFKNKKIIQLSENYIGEYLDQAVNNYYSKNMAFIAQINNPQIKYMAGYNQQVNIINLNINKVRNQQKQTKQVNNDKQNYQEQEL